MPGFLYFIPGGTMAIDLAAVRALGLGYAFEESVTRREVKAGPGGANGVLVTDSTRVPGELLAFYPERQTWRKIPGLKGEVWIGLYNDLPRPGPDDLGRKEQISGHRLTLLDGNSWLAPVAWAAGDQDGRLVFSRHLPQSLDLSDEGEWISAGVLPRYAEFSDLAGKWFEDRMRMAETAEAQDGGGYTAQLSLIPDILDAAVAALKVNYAIGRIEAVLLKLLSVDRACDVLDCAIDYPKLEEFHKKKLAASAPSNSSAGGGDSPPPTAPA